MSARNIPSTDSDYHLVLLDKDGNERREANGTFASDAVTQLLSKDVTDVFIASHGWKGDVPAATRQYDNWFAAAANQRSDIDSARAIVHDFKALTIGVHWPSLPWGDEDLPQLLGPQRDQLASERRAGLIDLIDLYADRIADTPSARTALAEILEHARSADSTVLRPRVKDAYTELYAEAHLVAGGACAAPGFDHSDFAIGATTTGWEAALEEDFSGHSDLLGAERGSNLRDALLGPMRQLSFWAMKRRALVVGQSGVHELVSRLQRQVPHARVHLMGHSFGCIVVTAAVSGPSTEGEFLAPLPRPIDSLFLVQGAMSLWSFAGAIGSYSDAPGYFSSVRDRDLMVRGPIVTTQSENDRAVGTFYPIGARMVGDRTLAADEPPEFGALGTFGAQGVDAAHHPILPSNATYGFEPGGVYNIDATSVIAEGPWPSGAHSDIAHARVAHLLWQAALSGR